MDTKLKNYRYSVWFKLLAVLLCITGMITLAYGLLQAPYFEDAIQNTEYKDSMAGKNIFWQAYNTVSTVAFTYKNEEYIKSGKALIEEEISSRKTDLEQQRQNDLQIVESNYQESINQFQYNKDENNFNNGNSSDSTDIIAETRKKDMQERIDLLRSQKEKNIKEINEKYDNLINKVEEDYRNQQLSDLQAQLNYLKTFEGIYYTVIEKNQTVLSNLSAKSGVEEYYNSLSYSVQLTNNNFYEVMGHYNYVQYPIPSDTTVYIGMSEERYNKEVAEFKNNSDKGLNGIKISAFGLLSFLTGLIYLLYSAGRRTDKDGVYLIAVDIIFLDVALAVGAAAIALCMTPMFEFLPYFYRENIRYNINLVYAVFSIIIAIGTLIGLLLMTMLSKRIKRREVIKHTLIYRLLKWIVLKLQAIYHHISSRVLSVYDRSPLAMRLVLTFGGYALLIFISSLILIASGGDIGFLIGIMGIIGVNVVAVYFLLKTFKTFTEIRDGAERIRAGELNYNIPEQGVPELRQLSATINKIADGLKTAVGSQVKAERMKAELITNVSHDLKTPLTSIITYVDLLKNEGLQSENADKYLGIIDSKSQRLKALTEDLFEAAKATSGNIAVNYERINVASLINQGLGELSDKIEASGLMFKTSLPAENVFFNADGRLLWRVIENLLSNVFKYALPNSRVYIDVTQSSEKVKIVIKNISAYELNVDENELMERFKRGDASRHSEGSGLGLSIAKSLTELQGGSFSINIDGDLFKAIIEMPKVRE